MIAVTLILFVVTIGPLHAQNAPAASAPGQGISRPWASLGGQRLRLRGVRTLGATEASVVEGRLISAAGDTLRMRLGSVGDMVTVVATPSTSVERWQGGGSGRKTWILGGVLLGAFAGGATASAVHSPPSSNAQGCSGSSGIGALGCLFVVGTAQATADALDQAATIALGVAIGATVGGFVGAAIGKGRARTGWQPVRNLAVTAMPGVEGGLTLGVSLAH